jgi:2'-5' RNA ligase
MLVEACRCVAPIRAALREFRFFRHGRGKATVWLAPEPADEFARLQAALQETFPEYDDVSRHKKGFTPHLSVGQTGSPESLAAELQAGWKPPEFTLDGIALIRREGDTPFQVAHTAPLTGGG